jgi:hypothetical protein
MLCAFDQRPEEPSPKRALWHALDRRRTMSNIHCTTMVRAFMAREHWPILSERVVIIPDTTAPWLVWLARPTC